MKLTKNQIKALSELAKRQRGESFMPSTCAILVHKGMAAYAAGAFDWRKCVAITEAGRAALKEMGE